ncbi:pyruvate dehydrogenase E2 component (dihydrolipoamide acetyltransferase) [Abditibacterium utsteinense]|uniref:Dihydrolipoamide acetyltransferase component of pyruvate dehydrogenase complex n=1 Tax=Abditibacterium utsteinense TaxID=1960156 RepID=A0A2S8STG3_9BACT|nr:2-oxo acid dehydrogenase subunit E2 [Abditibacterium utsteinense]PQV64087.1 pyruvate dehydrogenase E2 component (dihydrolipoamide acetyltransferase) [Abditibacterium utsteinense]
MAEFKLPTLGESATSGTVAKVLVAPGDTVAADQSILELETDKAVLEVPSTVAGVVKELLVKTGDTVSVDQPIFTYEDGAAPASNGSAATAPATTVEAAPAEQTASSQAATGAAPQSNGSAPAPADKNDGMVDTASPIGTQAPAPIVNDPGAVQEPVAASPSIRRMAREAGVDIHAVKGSGIGGRITENDIQNFGKTEAKAPAATQTSAIERPALPDFSKLGETIRVPMSGIRKATSNQMERAWTIPHVTQFDKCDSTQFDAFRKQYAALAEKRGAKLTPTAILLKIAVAALKKFPNFNASIDFASNEVVQKKFYNIGVAVDTPRGLVVPVIKNVESKGIIELAVELGEIAATAREGKLKPEQMSGGTFTLTNLGGIGGTYFTPIVNTPETAILGIARGTIEPVWNKESGAFEPKMMMPLCLSYDHRVIDGADGARFTRFIAAMIEDPALIALES